MSKRNSKTLTPMMKQYMSVKENYQEAVVFFRMGDFFEMFFEDAKLVSRELEITQTHRGELHGEPIPMAGVPHHAYKNYVNGLVEKGYTVVICDQVEDAKLAKGLVKREVTRIVTPGMVLDPDALDSRSHHYLLAAYFTRKRCGLAMLDLSTGDFRVTEVAPEDALSETQRIGPSEILLHQDQMEEPLVQEFMEALKGTACKERDPFDFRKRDAYELLCTHFNVNRLDGFGVIQMDAAVCAAGAVLRYVQETQKNDPPHISRLIPYYLKEHMILDDISRKNLELTETLHERTRKGSVLGLLDRSVTAMGGRKIRQWLLYPLLDKHRIDRRLQAVELFHHHGMIRDALREQLKQVQDLERLNGKVASNIASPRDFWMLRTSLEAVPALSAILGDFGPALEHFSILHELDPIPEVSSQIQEMLNDEPPATFKEGGVIRAGFDEELDELRDIAAHGKDRILQMEAAERESTGISSLKIKFNKVFGYFIEVSKPNLKWVPDHYERKQTMVNHERYITTELKEFQEKILTAEERSLTLEQELFLQLRDKIASYGHRIAILADRVAQLDALSTFAELAARHDYTKPTIHDSPVISLKQARHPVVEQMMRSGQFVANDIELNQERQFILLTGPNMSGKSTIMRQTALLCLLAQIGSFVPAQEAHIGICDRIFTRVGASDNLAGGQSTFMVEMTETANILHNGTSRSLVLLDEIGRGTSTFDGISIAWAVAEYLHNRLGCRTLFATHYHELTELEFCLDHIRNMSISIQEQDDEILFLHKLVDGGTNHSYGIQVARLAGLPRSVVRRANTILTGLEQGKLPSSADLSGFRSKEPTPQLSLFAPPPTAEAPPSFLQEELEDLDPNQLSPMEALQLLHTWKQKLNQEF